jgi:hypothetical protein
MAGAKQQFFEPLRPSRDISNNPFSLRFSIAQRPVAWEVGGLIFN